MRDLPTPHWLAAIVTSSALLGLVGCGGGEDVPPAETAVTAETAAAFDPCSFVTAQDLAEIVGNPLLAGSTANEPGQCHWNSQAPEDVSVVLAVQPAGEEGAAQACAALSASSNEDFEVANWQFQALPVGAIAVLEVCENGNRVSLTLAGDRGEEELRVAAVTIASRVLEQL